MDENTRNCSLDTLKTFCCILVVLQHLWFVCIWINNWGIQIVSMAVPLFFMISGYFTSYETPLSKYWKRWKRIGKILLCSIIFYIVLYSAVDFLLGGALLKIPTTTNDVWRILLFNDLHTIGRGHLWYLATYLYVIAFFAMLKKINCMCLISLLPLLLIFHLLIPETSKYHDFNNIWFIGIPCFALGMLIKKYFSIVSPASHYLSGGIALSMFILLLSGIASPIVSVICQWIFAIGLFVFFTSIKQYRSNILSEIGERYTLYIYVFHMAVIDLFFSMEFPHRYFYHMSFVSPFIIFFLTLFVSVAYKNCYDRIEVAFKSKFNTKR